MLGVSRFITRRRVAPGLAAFAQCWRTLVPLGLLLATYAVARAEPTVEELKARISAVNVSEKARLCLEIAEKQLTEADKLYAADDLDKAQQTLTDVVAYSELARDYSIQSNKHQKQTEIAMRTMSRKLNDLLHALTREEQAPVKEAISRLERVRDDLLAAMFPKGAK
jgi:ribosomal protein L16 Arg81 hydroxylase